jgi:4'-phosphopantetheinyl transferase
MVLPTIFVPAARSWNLADAAPVLAADEVHLWQARLDGEVGERFASVRLPDEERLRAQRYGSESARARFLASRRLLRGILAPYVKRVPEELVFDRTAEGKPFLAGGDVHFNLAHTSDRLLLGVARAREVGVDLERIDRRVDALRIARRILADEEVDALRALPNDLRVRGFFRTWAAHEALVKMVGTGMFASSRSFAVDVDPTRPPTTHTTLSLSAAVGEVPIAGSHVGALATEGSAVPRVLHWNLPSTGTSEARTAR